jgi:hypothetical protein
MTVWLYDTRGPERHVYQRTGQGWQARLTPRGRITWKWLTAAAITPRRAAP